MAAKLEIDTLSKESARDVCSNALNADELRRFRRIVQREAVYIVAVAQVIREQRRAAEEAAKEQGR